MLELRRRGVTGARDGGANSSGFIRGGGIAIGVSGGLLLFILGMGVKQ